ncbi:MAG: MarR family winged helix-turn-helix transcriptional regulator [Frankia sp.]
MSLSAAEAGAVEGATAKRVDGADGADGAVSALADEVLAAVSLLRRHTRRAAGQPFSPEAVSEAQRELLRLIRRNPGTSIAASAAELGLAANTVSTLVGQLTEQGLVLRSPDPGDRRVARLTLTDTASRRVEAWRDRRSALIAAALDGLDADERAALAAALPALMRLGELIRPGPDVDPGPDRRPGQHPDRPDRPATEEPG